MKILDLPLKKQWYEMIESGIKTEEYREKKPYWCKRLLGVDEPIVGEDGCNIFGYTHVRFRYGYTKRTMLFQIIDISIGYGKTEWGAPQEQVFIIRFKNEH